MGQNKLKIRQAFRETCLKRDKYRCAMCGWQPKSEEMDDELEIHHIVSRKDMPNGGYILENGISLCGNCHWKAEQNIQHGSYSDFAADKLYIIINSSYEKAVEASKLLKYD